MALAKEKKRKREKEKKRKREKEKKRKREKEKKRMGGLLSNLRKIFSC
ncbi:MAG: hypothetical protein PHS16_00070 [Candidatus Colwellbacteria bacterium]|nr:hypothetical protein [Candidatus Colwellbacteria bacterium]